MTDYLPSLLWLLILGFVLTRHVQVYRVYNKQLHLLRSMEGHAGLEGTEIVANNLRVRYAIRIALALCGIFLGLGGLIGVSNPAFATSPIFGAVVLVYFFASEIGTGYLTIRDKRVIAQLLEIDQEQGAEPMGHE